jgi:hypothetical protein
MKIHSLFFGLFLFLSSSVCSQGIDDFGIVTEGPEVEVAKKYEVLDNIGTIESSFYVLRARRMTVGIVPYMSRIRLEKRDVSMNVVKALDLDAREGPSRGPDFVYHSAHVLGNKVILIYNTLLRPHTICFEIYNANLVREKSDQIVEFFDESTNFGKKYDVRVVAQRSPDESKLMIGYYLETGKNSIDEIGFKIFDKNLNVLGANKMTFPYKSYQNFLFMRRVKSGFGRSTDFDDEGNLYMLSKVYRDGRAKDWVDGRINFDYKVLSFENGANRHKELILAAEGSYLTDAMIELQQDGKLLCIAIYTNEGKRSVSLDGIKYFLIDPKTQVIEKQSVVELPASEILKYEKRRIQAKAQRKEDKGKNVEFSRFKLWGVIPTAGGSFVILEQQYEEIVHNSVANSDMSSGTVFFHADDIAVVKVDDKINYQWLTIIPKRQVDFLWAYIGFTAIKLEEGVVFTFNDNVKNRSYEENNKIYKWIRGKNASTSIAALYYLDSNGNKKRFELYDPSKDYRIDLRIGGASNYFDASTLIFFTQRKKKAKFIRLDLHNN